MTAAFQYRKVDQAIYSKDSQINESQQKINSEQSEKVEEFINNYVENTQLKQFLFNSMVWDTEQTDDF